MTMPSITISAAYKRNPNVQPRHQMQWTSAPQREYRDPRPDSRRHSIISSMASLPASPPGMIPEDERLPMISGEGEGMITPMISDLLRELHFITKTSTTATSIDRTEEQSVLSHLSLPMTEDRSASPFLLTGNQSAKFPNYPEPSPPDFASDMSLTQPLSYQHMSLTCSPSDERTRTSLADVLANVRSDGTDYDRLGALPKLSLHLGSKGFKTSLLLRRNAVACAPVLTNDSGTSDDHSVATLTVTPRSFTINTNVPLADVEGFHMPAARMKLDCGMKLESTITLSPPTPIARNMDMEPLIPPCPLPRLQLTPVESGKSMSPGPPPSKWREKLPIAQTKRTSIISTKTESDNGSYILHRFLDLDQSSNFAESVISCKTSDGFPISRTAD